MSLYVTNDRVAWLLLPETGKRFTQGIYVLDAGDWKVIEAILGTEWRTGRLGERRKQLALLQASRQEELPL